MNTSYFFTNDSKGESIAMSYHPPTVQELHDAYAEELIDFATSIVDCPETAKDIVYGVFYDLLTLHPFFENARKGKSYLYVAVRNRCFDHLAHQKVKGRYERFMLAQPLAADEMEAVRAAEMASQELVDLVRQAIAQLPERTRAIVEACLLEGKTVAEVAAALNITPKTIWNCLRNARAVIAQQIRNDNPELSNFKLFFLVLLQLLPLLKAIWIIIAQTVR